MQHNIKGKSFGEERSTWGNPREQTANRKGSHGTAEHAGALTDDQPGGCTGIQDCLCLLH